MSAIDQARVLPGLWELQNASMEWQRAEVKCEGDHRIRPGMRVTLKYVGERFSGEYVAERVNHEFSADGFVTELHLRRNRMPKSPKRQSAVDGERENDMRGQIRGLNAENRTSTGGDAAAFHVGRSMDGETKFADTMNDAASEEAEEESVQGNAFLTKSEKKDIYCFSFNIWQKNRYRNFTYFSYDRNKLREAYMYKLDNTPSQIRQYPREDAPAILLSQDLNGLVLLEIVGNEWRLAKGI